MLSQPRLDEIMKLLRLDRRVSVADLVDKLQVSDETIRRDLKLLEEQGELRRVHGGAILPKLTEEQPIDVRGRIKQREKARLAQYAAGFIHEGMSVFLDTGTTTLALAQRLIQYHNLAVVTNSLDIAQALVSKSENKVTILPGDIRRNDNAIVGYSAVKAASWRYYDVAFLGIAAIDITQGFMDYEEDEAAIRRAVIEQSGKSMILADDSKFGRKTHIRTCAISDVDTVITNKKPKAEYLRCFSEAGVEIVYE